MFTGIVQSLARVIEVRDAPAGAGRRLVIERAGWKARSGRIEQGDSICVSGVCLTAVEVTEDRVGFDVIPETLSRTTLGSLTAGIRVNVESSLTAETSMGGHFVQGHVEATGTVAGVQTGSDYRITIDAPAQVMAAVIEKGSVTIDGVSMTVAGVRDAQFEVAVIPATRENTTLGIVGEGDRVNLESDVISRTVVETIRRMTEGKGEGSDVTVDLLRRAGFTD
ncbi:MAG: riboflavin synthase [Phycisphaeraceae bacterium]|nr:riboflavin synthase [Phycisphaeraceae bacterium]